MDRYELVVPTPPRLAAISLRHHPRSTEDWVMLTPRHQPGDDLASQLVFALKWEGVDLAILSALFDNVGGAELEAYVRKNPTGAYARRAWRLYEWLTGKTLDVSDPGKVSAVPVVDAGFQAALQVGELSTRHRVIDNLPGTPAFCPMVRRTPKLALRQSGRLDEQARVIVEQTHPDLVARAASFLLLSDTKSSFAIEGERVSGTKAARWSAAIREAGSRALSVHELERLQRIVIDPRGVVLGVRSEGGFVGRHDRVTGEALPEHINARPEDLPDLLAGIVAFGTRATAGEMDPVVAAASLAFGFVYVHPFVDGNGRLHRWLIHHMLAQAGYGPPGIVFPVSAAILRDEPEYKRVLESYSKPLLPLIDWTATTKGNVQVRNETARFYRYFDATAHAEFLYDCIAETVEVDLPQEVAFLKAYDRFVRGVNALLDLTSRQTELLRIFLENHGGRLSQRVLSKEFAFLLPAEVTAIEALYQEAFQGSAT
jgi:hypothetical protein